MAGLVLHRAVSRAERDDWRASRMLRSRPGGMEGKHLTDSVRHALDFARMFQERGWESDTMFVLQVTFEPGAEVPLYEQLQDGIGPAYFADDAALELVVDVVEVCRVEVENEV